MNSKFIYHLQADQKKQKTAENKRKKKSLPEDEDDLDVDNLDWWSKYFASVDTLIQVFFYYLAYTDNDLYHVILTFNIKEYKLKLKR